MTDINDITKNGFSLEKTKLELFSLRISLIAYFSTYRTMEYNLHAFFPENEENQMDEFYHNNSYVEKCTEAIIHLHHFVELVCKDILRDEHRLLADFTSDRHHIILYKLINDTLSDEENQKLQSIEFQVALERLIELIRNRKIKNHEKLIFIKEAKVWLESLNNLRNRLIHRGIFVLRYPALDSLFGKYALPFIEKVVALAKYSNKESSWKYTNLSCGIDPISEIINTFRQGSYNIGKVAMLKELGRSAYEQPRKIKNWSFLDEERQLRAERIANSETVNVAGVRQCPVCGAASLVIYDEIEVDGENYRDHTYEKAWLYIWQVHCMNCTFEVNHHLENPKEYDLPIDDFWYGQELT